jgi:hypothetical protein
MLIDYMLDYCERGGRNLFGPISLQTISMLFLQRLPLCLAIPVVIADALTAKRPRVPPLNLMLSNLPKRVIDRMLARRLGLTARAAG